MFTLGTQYFRPPTPEERHWERDLTTAREHGLGVIRAWVFWNWCCPREGEYRFAAYERLADLCARLGLKIIFLMNLEGAPPWAAHKFPDAIFTDWNDRKYYPQAKSHSAGGGFPGLCFHHTEAMNAAYDFIAAFSRHFKDHPALTGFEPQNEPQIEASRFTVNRPYCYCARSIRAFQEWMRNRYRGDIEAAGEAWHTCFGRFEDIEPPRVFGAFSDWLHWRGFMLETFADSVDRRYEAIRAGAPDATLIGHSAGACMISHNVAIEGIDDWRHAKMADIYGAIGFPVAGGVQAITMGLDQARKAAAGKPYWLAETNAGQVSFGLYRQTFRGGCLYCGGTPDEEMLPVTKASTATKSIYVDPREPEMWTLLSLAHGATGIIYWQFCHERYGLEYTDGMINLDGSPGPYLKRFKELTPFFRENEELLQNAKVPRPRVGILFAPQGYIMNFAGMGCAHMMQNALMGTYAALWDCDYPIDFLRLDDEVVDDDYSSYKVLYLPFPLWISESAVKKLWKFVENGGLLISEASAAQYLPDGFSSEVIPGMGLDKLFGCRREDIASRQIVQLKAGDLMIPSCMYREVLRPTTGRVIGHFLDGAMEETEPAIVENQVGRGRTIYLGSNPFMRYVDSRSETLRTLVNRWNADVARPVWSDSPDVSARMLESGDRRLIYIINTGKETVNTVVRFAEHPGDGLRKLLGEGLPAPIERVTNGGAQTSAFTMKPWEVRVLATEQIDSRER